MIAPSNTELQIMLLVMHHSFEKWTVATAWKFPDSLLEDLPVTKRVHFPCAKSAKKTGVGALLISGETVHFTLQSSSIVKLIILLRKWMTVCLIHRIKHRLCESHINGQHFIWQNPSLFTQDRLVWRQAVHRLPLSRFAVCRFTRA